MRRYACLDSKKKITLLRPVKDDEYADFTYLSQKYGNYIMEVKYYEIFDKPYKEFINFLKDFIDKSSKLEIFDINRYTMNYLFGIRTFLDHWETHIKRNYRSNKQYIDVYKEAISYEYDNHMAYRLVYRLRNYVQHCEMPISSVTEKLNTNNEKEIIVYVNRDRLLSNYKKWKPEEVEYLKSLEEEFEITPLFDEMNDCLFRIHDKLINFNIDKDFILDCISVLKLRKQFKEYEGTLAIVEYDDEEDNKKVGKIFFKGNTKIKINELHTQICEHILREHIKNNDTYVKIFNYCGICIGDTDISFPHAIGEDENGTRLFVKGKEIINVNNRNWVRLHESTSLDGINKYVAVYADAKFGMKKLTELTRLYSDLCKLFYNIRE